MHISTSVLASVAVLTVNQVAAWPAFLQVHGKLGHNKGIFKHEGVEFELFHPDASAGRDTAYAHYLDGVKRAHELSVLEERGYDPTRRPDYHWLNCTAEGTFVGGCNNDHKTAPRDYHQVFGHDQTGKDLNMMFAEAFDGKRSRKSPRSICKSSKIGNLCVSWDEPIKEKIRVDQQQAMVEYAMTCIGPKGMLSSEFRTNFKHNVTSEDVGDFRFVCVSNRAKGCDRTATLCIDLWNRIPYATRGGIKEHQYPNHWNHRTSWSPWSDEGKGKAKTWNAKGPCTKNCDKVGRSLDNTEEEDNDLTISPWDLD